MKCKPNLYLAIAIFIVGLTLFFGLATGKGANPAWERVVQKRGYLLDRQGEPLVVNKERFKAYLLLKGDTLLGREWPKELQPYLNRPLDLPKKGLVLLSENLSLEEVKKLRGLENVIIKGEIERKPLFQELKPLIGDLLEDKGFSGLEKAFDPLLREGKSVLTSLDLNFLKKIYYISKNLGDVNLKGVSIFKVSTGELLGYYASSEKDWLEEELPLSERALPVKIDSVNWNLGASSVGIQGVSGKICPLHLVKALLTETCGRPIDPTLLPQREETCQPLEETKEYLYRLSEQGDFLYALKERNWLFLFWGAPVKVEGKGPDFERLKKNLQYLAKFF